ncbi:MAG: GNAT family N-acetyltransferase [Acidobacteriota bacterium]
MIIETPRLRLVPLTLPFVTSTPDDRATLARECGAEVPASWPPELWDQDAQDWCRRILEADPSTDWIPRCMVLRELRPVACGAIGFGAPDPDGRVIIGYGVLPEFRRRGYAAEALGGIVKWAFEEPRVHVIAGDTYPNLIASIRTMERNGFQFAGKGQEEGTVRYELTRTG